MSNVSVVVLAVHSPAVLAFSLKFTVSHSLAEHEYQMWTHKTMAPEIADSHPSPLFSLCRCLGPHWKARPAWNARRWWTSGEFHATTQRVCKWKINILFPFLPLPLQILTCVGWHCHRWLNTALSQYLCVKTILMWHFLMFSFVRHIETFPSAFFTRQITQQTHPPRRYSLALLLALARWSQKCTELTENTGHMSDTTHFRSYATRPTTRTHTLTHTPTCTCKRCPPPPMPLLHSHFRRRHLRWWQMCFSEVAPKRDGDNAGCEIWMALAEGQRKGGVC